MKMKKVLATVLSAVMIAGCLTGCGSSSGDSAGTGTGDNSGSEFDSSKAITVVSREDGSGTRGAFIELFGIEEKDADGNKVDNTTEDASVTNNTSVMMSTVAGNEYAIGYISLGSLNDSIKSCATSLKPSFVTILNGREILYVPLLILSTVASFPSIFTAFTESFKDPREI